MRQAPEHPTTVELHNLYPFSVEASFQVAEKRFDHSEALMNPEEQTFGAMGYCARPPIEKLDVVMEEGRKIAELSVILPGCTTSHRGPPWKPRSDPSAYHGEDTTDPEGVFRSVREEAQAYGHVSLEIGYLAMLERYADMSSFVWSGSRNVKDLELIEAIALRDPDLPFGIKNGLDGKIDDALALVDLVNRLRRGGGAPAVLVYRGGENATNPDLWEKQYLEALRLTKGRMIVDTAHGGEMAHDPNRRFEKTPEGQEMTMQHINYLATMGYLPAGVISEASDLVSRVDPHMPLQIAINGVTELVRVKRGTTLWS